jgi:hypothetical protein
LRLFLMAGVILPTGFVNLPTNVILPTSPL